MDEPGAGPVVSRPTMVETISVFATKVRTGELDATAFARLRGLLATHIARGRYLVARMLNVHFERAQGLIKDPGLVRQIRTLDALQLAVALHLHETAPIDHFVCADQRFCIIATLEGLAVINPEVAS